MCQTCAAFPTWRPTWAPAAGRRPPDGEGSPRLEFARGRESLMERRLLNVRKYLLRKVLPVLRVFPLPLASRMVAGIGRTEYHLVSSLRASYQEAVARAREILGCNWDVGSVSRDLAGNQVWWRTRDLLLDGVADRRAEPMFLVSGRDLLDTALGEGKGVILLTSHFGGH